MVVQTLNLANFLLARIDEEEDQARRMVGWARPGERAHRLMADCAARRDIVREHIGYGGICGTCGVRTPETGERWPCRTLRLLSFPYIDHPDYRDEWRP